MSVVGPEDRHQRHAPFDQTACLQDALPMRIASVAIAQCGRFTLQIKGIAAGRRIQQLERLAIMAIESRQRFIALQTFAQRLDSCSPNN